MVDLDLWWSESWGSHEFQGGVADELSGEPKERLLEVVVGLGGDVVVLLRVNDQHIAMTWVCELGGWN